MADETIKELTNKELDKLYKQTAGPMLDQIQAISNVPTSAMQQKLTALDQEANRLDADGVKIKANNAQLEQTLTEYRRTTNTASTLIQASDNAIQNAAVGVAVSAVTSKVFGGAAAAILSSGRNPVALTSIPLYENALSDAGANWNFLSPADFAQGYVQSDAWREKMDAWGDGYADLTEQTIIGGIAQGWGPKKVASEVRKHAENIPVHAAENLTRTLQITSYRDASLGMEVVNNQFIEGKIRIATLDGATCLNCISLHGTPLELGEKPADHYRGRCDVFYIVPGGPRTPEVMQADSIPGERRFVPYQTGEEWFNSLPSTRQAQQASFLKTPAKLRAFNDGVPLSAFRGDHVDDVFGNQKIEQSLVKALGDAAEQYYQTNQ